MVKATLDKQGELETAPSQRVLSLPTIPILPHCCNRLLRADVDRLCRDARMK